MLNKSMTTLLQFLLVTGFLGVCIGFPDRTVCHFENQRPKNHVNTTQLLRELRLKLISTNLDALLIRYEDEHQNLFAEPSSRNIHYISGFSGSTASAIVTKDKAVLWTDGRYHIQADNELDCNWILMRFGLPNIPTIEQWLYLEFPNGAKIGADPKRNSAIKWEEFEKQLKAKNNNFELVKTTPNLIGSLWKNKPKGNIKKAFFLPENYTGQNWQNKVKKVRRVINSIGADAMVISVLDEIAWLLNIRGYDSPFSPVAKSYLFLSNVSIVLFMDENKRPENFSNIYEIAGEEPVINLNYNAIWTELPNYVKKFKKILLSAEDAYKQGISKEIYDMIPNDKRLLQTSPIVELRAVKNNVEIIRMEKAHIQEAVSFCEFLEFYEKHDTELDERTAAKTLDKFRSKGVNFFSLSFPTIAGYGPNSAKAHYVPTLDNSLKLQNGSLFLMDSGGQYLGGTTDMTRTLSVGTPTSEQIIAYTHVLMAMIDLSSLVFPSTLKSSQIDVVARKRIWELGYDYSHGTGHGIGSFLQIHEGPAHIKYKSENSSTFKPGYFTSIEPGIYLEGKFGIRLENIARVINKTKLKYNDSPDKYLGFKTVTLVPFDIKLIDFSLLDNIHITWLYEYYQTILHEVGEEMKQQRKFKTYDWLTKEVNSFLKQLEKFEKKSVIA